MDNFLKFNVHVDRVVLKANAEYRGVSRVIGMKGLDERRRVWVYQTMVRPILLHGCPVWALLTVN